MTEDTLKEFEARCAEAWKAGKIRVPCHLSGGDERELIELFKGIKPTDWVVSTHRNHYHYLLHGGNADALFKEIIGEDGGLCGGLSGSMHTTDRARRFVSSCLVGCGCPVAVGIASGVKEKKGKEHVWCFIGDGAVDQGMFWESVVYAEGRNLPVTFVVEDNNRSVNSTKADRGVQHCWSRDMALYYSPKVKVIKFQPTYPHVADGSFVSF
jgi:pyruvate dehydrogenase E1 component alpha subunit